MEPLVIRLALATVALLVVGLSPAVADDPNTTTGTTDSAIWAQTEGPAELTSHPEAGPTATVPAAFYTAYQWRPACGTVRPGSPVQPCPSSLQWCPPDQTMYNLFGLHDGAWLHIRRDCFTQPPANTATPQVTPALVARAFQRIPIPTYASLAQPAGKTLVNFDTIFHAEAAAFTRTLTLLGQRVELRITPTRFVWHFGDGTTLSTSTPGAAYPSKAITHRYTDAHLTVRHRVTVTWTATYRLDGGPQQPVPGSVVRPGPATALRIAEAVPALTAG